MHGYKQDGKRIFEGVLFKRGSETLAAVHLGGKGTVWLRKDLDEERALMLAALSTALLLKPDLETLE